MLKRTDTAMDVIWPSTGPLVFFGDDLPRAPASAFVMDVLGISPPGSGLQATVDQQPRHSSRFLPSRLQRQSPGRADDIGSNYPCSITIP